MPNKMIEISTCFQCPYCYWYENHKSFGCIKKRRNVIYGIETIPSWCPLPESPITELSIEPPKYIAF